MWKKPKPAEQELSPSDTRDSEQNSAPENTQLSDDDGVESDVSSVALSRGLLAVGMQAPAAEGGLSDAEMMLRVKAGDDSAFDYLVQKYRRAMISFMYRMAHNSAAAEDLAQEVFLRVYRSRSSYEASAKFTTWLYRIATNLAMNFTRDTRHERPENQVSLDDPAEEDSAPLDVADRRLTAEQDLLRRERLQQIRKRVQ